MKQTINDYIPEETLCRLTEEAFQSPGDRKSTRLNSSHIH